VGLETALGLSLEELGYLLLTAARDRLAWLAPLSGDPQKYAADVAAAYDAPDVGTDRDAVESFMAARAGAYGQRDA
jgi:hypothetical protein